MPFPIFYTNTYKSIIWNRNLFFFFFYVAGPFIYTHRSLLSGVKKKKENAVALFLALYISFISLFFFLVWPFASYSHARTNYTVLHPVLKRRKKSLLFSTFSCSPSSCRLDLKEKRNECLLQSEIERERERKRANQSLIQNIGNHYIQSSSCFDVHSRHTARVVIIMLMTLVRGFLPIFFFARRSCISTPCVC